MTLTTNDQLMLLHNLLLDHAHTLYGEENEYRQIKRLVTALLENEQLQSESFKALLPDVYTYATHGTSINDTRTNHIRTNIEQLHYWVQSIERLST